MSMHIKFYWIAVISFVVHQYPEMYFMRVKQVILTITTEAQNKVVLSYHKVRGPYFLIDIFAATIILLDNRVL